MKSSTDKKSAVIAGKKPKKVATNMVKDGSSVKAPGKGKKK